MAKFIKVFALFTFTVLTTYGCGNSNETNTTNIVADTVVVNADIYTADKTQSRANAFALKDGRFIAIGDNETIQGMTGPATNVIDAEGKTIIPGLVDGHIHLMMGLRLITGVDLSYIPEKETWLRLIKEKDATLPEGQWLVGGNWDYTLSEGELPTKEDIDAVVPDRPVVLNDIDGHSVWVNSKAIELAGITADTPVPTGGQIMLDPETGEPTGIFLESAQQLFRGLDGFSPTPEQTREALKLAVARANSVGITSVHEIGPFKSADLYLSLFENGELTLRTWFGSYMNEASEAPILAQERARISAATAAIDTSKTGPLFEFGFIKFYIDGVLSTYTAVMKEPYSDRPDLNGVLFMPQDALEAKIAAVNANGFAAAVHAIGDGAVSTVLDAYANVGNAPDGRPNRIEHIEVATPDDVRRFAELGVVAVMQPNHATGTIGKYINDRLGDEREKNAYVWQSMLKEGAHLILSSDWPTSPMSPLDHFNDAIFRESPFGLGNGPWHPEESVTFEQALYAYTQSPADITPWGTQTGSITVGKWADFVMLDGTLPAPITRAFRDLNVQSTYLAGKQVYSK